MCRVLGASQKVLILRVEWGGLIISGLPIIRHVLPYV